MECHICKEEKLFHDCYWCCLKLSCTECFKKVKYKCPFCRSSDIKGSTYEGNALKIIRKINLKTIEPDDYLYVILVRVLYCNLKDYPLTIFYSLQSTNIYINYYLGSVYEKEKEKEKAIEYYRKAYQTYKSQCAIERLMHLLYDKGSTNLKEIEKLFSDYKLTEKNKEVYTSFKGHIAFLNGQYDDAKSYYTASNYNSTAEYYNLYQIYMLEENYQLAEKAINDSKSDYLINKYSFAKRVGSLLEKEDGLKKIKKIEEILNENKNEK